MSANLETAAAVRNSLSEARMSTYEAATAASDDPLAALTLYAWNAQISAALLAPLHVCEVVVRNGVAHAIALRYGERWPWSPGFERSLPSAGTGYSPQRDLLAARKHADTTGKVIPELKFVFWQKMFTGRHDARLWNSALHTAFAHLDPGQSVQVQRAGFHDDLERVRTLRNRIAHHEPIFRRDLRADFATLHSLVQRRCPLTAAWMDAHQQVSALLGCAPLGAGPAGVG